MYINECKEIAKPFMNRNFLHFIKSSINICIEFPPVQSIDTRYEIKGILTVTDWIDFSNELNPPLDEKTSKIVEWLKLIISASDNKANLDYEGVFGFSYYSRENKLQFADNPFYN